MNENKDLFCQLKKLLPGYADRAIQNFINQAEENTSKPKILYTGSVRHKSNTTDIMDLLLTKLPIDLPCKFQYKNILVYYVNEFGQIVEEFENRFEKLKQNYFSMRDSYPKLADEIEAMHKKLHIKWPSYKHLSWAFYDSYANQERIQQSYRTSLKELVTTEEIQIISQNVKLGRKDIKTNFEVIREAKRLKNHTSKSMTNCMETACEKSDLSKKALINWWRNYWKLIIPEDIKAKCVFSTNKELPLKMFNKLSIDELHKCWEKYKAIREIS